MKKIFLFALSMSMCFTIYAQNIDELSADELCKQGDNLYRKKQYEKAEVYYWAAYGMGKEDALIDLFWCGYNTNDCKTIEKSLGIARMDTSNYEALFLQGLMEFDEFCSNGNVSDGMEKIELAAEHHNVKALSFLAEHYAYDTLKSLTYYKKAAVFGDGQSSMIVGDYYEKHNNHKKAFGYFNNAVICRYLPAYKRLALYYYYGWGDVKINKSYALNILNWAIMHGASDETMWMYNSLSDDMANDKTKKNVKAKEKVRFSEDESGDWCYKREEWQRAKDYYMKALLKGSETAGMDIFRCEYNMGMCDSAVNTLKKVIKNDKTGEAECEYGFMLFNGDCVDKNIEESIKYWESSAKKGYTKAINALGDRYRLGDGIEADSTKAFAYYCKSAKLDDNVGIFNLGVCYKIGIGVKIDNVKAAEYYWKALQEDVTQAYTSLALMYIEGDGIEKDLEYGMMLLNNAVTLGDYRAMMVLNMLKD